MMTLLVDRSRLATSEGPALAAIHRAIGTQLAVDLARTLPLEDYEIQHPTGPATGVRIVPDRQPVIIALLRAGLFLAEGLWERLPGSALMFYVPGRGLGSPDLGGRPTIIVDAVINTGGSLTPVIEQARRRHAGGISVVTLVGYRPTLERMAEAMPDITFTAARLSERSYVGSGATDTGARLFGTTRTEP